MAQLVLARLDNHLRALKLILDLRMRRRQGAVLAGAIASLTIISVAAAMMTQI
jgi:hypothetical protein